MASYQTGRGGANGATRNETQPSNRIIKNVLFFIIGVCPYMASYRAGRGETNGAQRNETQSSNYFLITIFFLLAAAPPPPADAALVVFVIATDAASAANAHLRYSDSNSSRSLVHNA